jgi:hypothetical protein
MVPLTGGIKLTLALDCRTRARHATYVGCHAGTTTPHAKVNYFPHSGTYEFGYRVTNYVQAFNDDISVYYPLRLFPSRSLAFFLMQFAKELAK